MKLRIISAFLLVVLLLSGCSSQTGEPEALADNSKKTEYTSVSELSEAKRFAVSIGTIFGDVVADLYPQAEILYYPGIVDCALAVAKHKADVAIGDAPVIRYIAGNTAGVGMLPEYLIREKYYFCLPKSERGEWLRTEFNEWLAVQKQNGEIERMYDFWCGDEEPDRTYDLSALPDPNGKIKITVGPTSRPDVYYSNNSLSGFPMELIYRFCLDRGLGGEVYIASDSLVSMLVTGKADLALSFLSYTEERAESVLYTDPILEGGIGVLVRSDDQENSSFWSLLKDGVERTFIRESRWKLLASGLGTAALITVGGFLLANVFGVVFCFCTMSKRKWLRAFADVYDRIMQGTPMVVILMILYYVIFGNSDISGSWVAIIAFGLTSGASLARQFSVSVQSIDRGQTEAALALGFPKTRAFLGIVFPQAARMALPGYFSEIISLMKGTSIVGYISVVDLTKAGDLIRSSTYDAFFPLLSVALVYFLISFGLLSLLKCFQKKLAPKRVAAQKEAAK